MVSALICAHADLEKDLGQTLLWRQDVDRHVVGRLEEARMMAVAARPSIVVDRGVLSSEGLLQDVLGDPATPGLSIVVVVPGGVYPRGEELLLAWADDALRLL